MSPRRWTAATRIAVAAAIVVGVLAIVRPWTVVPILMNPPHDSHAIFNAAGYVEAAWETQVIPTAEKTAASLLQVLQHPPAPTEGSGQASRRSVFVTGTLAVTEVDTRSRVGLARLSLPAGAAGAKVAIQIGPVIRGTALRDALEFIHFSDFENQLQFAEVAGALNEGVRERVLKGINPQALGGQTVSFIAAMTTGMLSADGTLELVPVKLELRRGPS